MTGLPRWAIAMIGLLVGVIAIVAALVLVGAANLCGLPDTAVTTGYCAASGTTQGMLVGIPTATTVVGYGVSLWTARLTPVLIAAMCTVFEGVVCLVAGY